MQKEIGAIESSACYQLYATSLDLILHSNLRQLYVILEFSLRVISLIQDSTQSSQFTSFTEVETLCSKSLIQTLSRLCHSVKTLSWLCHSLPTPNPAPLYVIAWLNTPACCFIHNPICKVLEASHSAMSQFPTLLLSKSILIHNNETFSAPPSCSLPCHTLPLFPFYLECMLLCTNHALSAPSHMSLY